MQFIEFKQKLEVLKVFNLTDIRKVEPDFDLRRLSEWREKAYIIMLRKGYYIFSELEINESTLSLIANKIYPPSYISVEMALSRYNLIPESVYAVTSVTSEKTKRFKTPIAEFIYRHIKPELLFGYTLVEFENRSYNMAEIEKAVLDFFYLNSKIKTKEAFEELRFNADEFKAKTDKQKLERYLKEFNNKSLTRRVNAFLKYIKYA